MFSFTSSGKVYVLKGVFNALLRWTKSKLCFLRTNISNSLELFLFNKSGLFFDRTSLPKHLQLPPICCGRLKEEKRAGKERPMSLCHWWTGGGGTSTPGPAPALPSPALSSTERKTRKWIEMFSVIPLTCFSGFMRGKIVMKTKTIAHIIQKKFLKTCSCLTSTNSPRLKNKQAEKIPGGHSPLPSPEIHKNVF